MPKHHPSNRVIVAKSDPADLANFIIVITMVCCFLAGALLVSPDVAISLGSSMDVAYGLLGIAGLIFVALIFGHLMHDALPSRGQRLPSGIVRKNKRRHAGARSIDDDGKGRLDHEQLHDHVCPRYKEHRGAWRLKQLEMELDLSWREKRVLKEMLLELAAHDVVIIDGQFITFVRQDYHLPPASRFRSTKDKVIYRPPSVAVEHKQFTDQHVGCGSVTTTVVGGGRPVASPRCKRRGGDKKAKQEKHAPAHVKKGKPRRAAVKQAKDKDKATKFSTRVNEYVKYRHGKQDTRLSFEQIQHGLGVADGQAKRLRAELDRLVSRSWLLRDRNWYVLHRIPG